MITTFNVNPEAFDVEYDEMQELLIESVKIDVLAEAKENARTQLLELADDVEISYGDEESELIENLRFTAEQNPLSETAYDLMNDAMGIL